MPLPHFSAVSSHNEKWEPIYKSLFEITFSLPPVLGRTTEEVKLMLENANSISLPMTPDIEVKEQRFKFSTRAFVTMPKQTHVSDISVKFTLNANNKNAVYVWNVLKAWYDLAWNAATGETHVKADMCGSIIVNVHNKRGDVIRRVTYRNVQIFGISQWDMSWEDSGAFQDAEAKFVADYFEDLYTDK